MNFRLRPRWLAHLLAILGNYFWIPCPICRRPFAGFEWAPGEALMEDWYHGWGICPDCIPESRRRNAEYQRLYFAAVAPPEGKEPK